MRHVPDDVELKMISSYVYIIHIGEEMKKLSYHHIFPYTRLSTRSAEVTENEH